jgi:hypothetical protein
MATYTSIWTPDYSNSIAPLAGTPTGTIATGASSGVITVGKRRIIHIVGINVTTPANLTAVSYTMGLSTGTVAANPVATSPFFTCDEGFTIDTGDMYDQINLGNVAAYNGAITLAYSITIFSKF